jgi:hypothetical protein
VLTPLLAAASGLLVLAGALKLRAGEAVGILEVALGCVAIAVPRPLVAALVAVAYAGFAAQSLRLAVVSGDAPEDCGCFGDVEAPAGLPHVVLNLGCALVAAAAAVLAPPSLASLVADAPLTGAVVLAGVIASVYGLFLAYTAFPTAWSSFQAGSLRET